MVTPRTPLTSHPAFFFGNFEVHAAAREIRSGSCVLRAPPKVFDLLIALLENRDRVVPRKEILELVWPRTEVARGALPQSMLKLRKLLGGEQASERWIATVRGVGYRFIGEVDERPAMPAGLSHAVPTSPRSQVGDEVRHRVEVLYQRGQEQAMQLEHDELRRTVALLNERKAYGADPRARVFALALGSRLERHAGNLEQAWQDLQFSEQLADQLADPLCQMAVLRSKGAYFFQFVSIGEAIPWYQRAFELAERHGATFDAACGAYLLAACFGPAGDVSGCEEWTERACHMALRTQPSWLWTFIRASLAGTHIHLGELAYQEGDTPRARRHWMQGLQMLDQAEAVGDCADLGKFAKVLPINRAWVQGYLYPDQRPATIQTLRAALAFETVPLLQLSHLLGLATFLMENGQLDEARKYCDQGLALGDSTRIFRYRGELLNRIADIATRQGRHADAVRHLHTQLRWRDETARADALRIAKVTALRLQTERALATLEVERNLAVQLQSENEDLRREAILRDTAVRLDRSAGRQTASVFRSWLLLAQTRAKLQGHSLALIVFSLRTQKQRKPEKSWALEANMDSVLENCLSGHLRSGDRWTLLDSGQLLLALRDVRVDQAQLASSRLRYGLAASLQPPAGSLSVGYQKVFDVALEEDMESTWQRIVQDEFPPDITDGV